MEQNNPNFEHFEKVARSQGRVVETRRARYAYSVAMHIGLYPSPPATVIAICPRQDQALHEGSSSRLRQIRGRMKDPWAASRHDPTSRVPREGSLLFQTTRPLTSPIVYLYGYTLCETARLRTGGTWCSKLWLILRAAPCSICCGTAAVRPARLREVFRSRAQQFRNSCDVCCARSWYVSTGKAGTAYTQSTQRRLRKWTAG